MDDFGLPPEPPQWALAGGLPEPLEDEGFAAYCERLGIDPEPLLVELDARTAVCAHDRLASYLTQKMPGAWREYVQARWLAGHPYHPRRYVTGMWENEAS